MSLNGKLIEKIEAINRGMIPEGYVKTEFGILPSDWKHTCFNRIFEEVSDRTSDTDKYPLYSLTIEDGIVPKTERYERSFLVKNQEDTYKIVRKDEFVYNPMNLRFGALARMKEDKEVSVSGYYNVFRVISDHIPEFFDNFLKSERMIHYYNTVATGSLKEKQRVHFSQFMGFKIPMPSVNESIKIASIISTWDKAIELNEKLIEYKKQIKNGLLQKLLSAKVRFSGFNSEWKEKKLGDIIDFAKKEVVKNPQDYYLLTVKLHLKGIEATDKKPNITEKGRPYFLREPNELLIGRQNFHNGGIGIVPPNMLGYIASNAISSINVKNADMKFVYYYISNPNFYKKVENIIGGTGQKEISESALKKLRIKIPISINEQTTIGIFLSKLDEEIRLLENQLELLKIQKKGLAQLLLTGKVRVKC